MNFRSVFCRGACYCFALGISFQAYVHAEEPAHSPELEMKSFGDGIVWIHIERSVGIERYSSTMALKNARLVKLGERYFIRGTSYIAKVNENDKEYAWLQGVEYGCAWSDVIEYYVFSPERFEQYMTSLSQSEG